MPINEGTNANGVQWGGWRGAARLVYALRSSTSGRAYFIGKELDQCTGLGRRLYLVQESLIHAGHLAPSAYGENRLNWSSFRDFVLLSAGLIATLIEGEGQRMRTREENEAIGRVRAGYLCRRCSAGPGVRMVICHAAGGVIDFANLNLCFPACDAHLPCRSAPLYLSCRMPHCGGPVWHRQHAEATTVPGSRGADRWAMTHDAAYAGNAPAPSLASVAPHGRESQKPEKKGPFLLGSCSCGCSLRGGSKTGAQR